MHKLWHKKHKLLCCNYHQESFTMQNTCKHNKTYICYTNMEYNYKKKLIWPMSSRFWICLHQCSQIFLNIRMTYYVSWARYVLKYIDLCVSSTQLIKTLCTIYWGGLPMVVKLETDYFYVPGTQIWHQLPIFSSVCTVWIPDHWISHALGVNEDTIPR